jgi:outer membrane murein-binding lipoprotein Lpp
VIPSNSIQRRFYNSRYKELVALVKTLEAEKRELTKEISNKRASVKNAKAKEAEVKKALGKQSTSETLIRKLEKVFERHCISKPYYHGGKYNGKSMVNFMTNSGRIMDDVKEALLQIDQGSKFN